MKSILVSVFLSLQAMGAPTARAPHIEFYCKIRNSENVVQTVQMAQTKFRTHCAVDTDGACWRVEIVRNGKEAGANIFSANGARVSADIPGVWGAFEKWEKNVKLNVSFSDGNRSVALNSVDVWKDETRPGFSSAQPIVSVRCALELESLTEF
jgi:hypothetical protein